MKLFNPKQLRSVLELNESFSDISISEQYESSIESIVNDLIVRYDLSTSFYIFAGHGDNGGDALGIALRLIGHGYTLHVYLINPTGELSDYCKKNKLLLEEFDADLIIEIGKGAFDPPIFNHESIIIDGVIGSGINRSLSGGYKGLIGFINQSGVPIISIDQPTGIGFSESSEHGLVHSCAQATLTYSFSAPKFQSLLKDLHLFFGEVKVIDMHIHPKAIQHVESEYELIDDESTRLLLRKREEFSEKRDFGHGYLIAGKEGMYGSAIIAGKAALRAGLGLLTVHVPNRALTVLQTAIPEAICDIDEGDSIIESMVTDSEYNAVGVGPGIGIAPVTQKAFADLINQFRQPIVIDADGLNILSKQPDLLRKIPGRSILTPHVREFDRLFGISHSDHERLSKAIQNAVKYSLTIVLKGRYTIVVSDQGKVYFNSTGNNGMSKAGMGDLLTGILLALLAQGYSTIDAARIGVFIHGASADQALVNQSEISLLPSDVCEKIGHSYNKIMRY